MWPDFVQINLNFTHEETGHKQWPDFVQIIWNFAHEEIGHALWPVFPKLINEFKQAGAEQCQAQLVQLFKAVFAIWESPILLNLNFG